MKGTPKLPSGITVGAAVEQSESANNIATWIAWILSKAKKKTNCLNPNLT